LREHCGERVRFRVPEGGFYLWTELSSDIDAMAVAERALADGVACRPGERFFGDSESGIQYLRIAFSQVSMAEIERGIAALGNAIAASSRSR
jgi:2-aminoadipate transaminase